MILPQGRIHPKKVRTHGQGRRQPGAAWTSPRQLPVASHLYPRTGTWLQEGPLSVGRVPVRHGQRLSAAALWPVSFHCHQGSPLHFGYCQVWPCCRVGPPGKSCSLSLLLPLGPSQSLELFLLGRGPTSPGIPARLLGCSPLLPGGMRTFCFPSDCGMEDFLLVEGISQTKLLCAWGIF